MKIILTGANGLVGRSCQYNSLKNNHNLTIISRKKAISCKSNQFLKLSNIKGEKLSFDLLIHCASATPLNSEMNDVLKINKDIDKDLHEFLRRIPVKHIVYLSSMAVYGKVQEDKINEFTPSIELNPYGESKLQSENGLKELSKKTKNKLSILRLPGVVGFKMSNIFFKRLYNSIINEEEIMVKSTLSKFNNAVLDSDVFFTSINLYNKQKKDLITINHHSQDTLSLGSLITEFTKVIGKKCLLKESSKCNPPFLITNLKHEELLIKTRISDMINIYHSYYS